MKQPEFCPKCNNQTNYLNRIEMYEKDKENNADQPLFFFVCDTCFGQIEKFLAKPQKFPGRRRGRSEYF